MPAGVFQNYRANLVLHGHDRASCHRHCATCLPLFSNPFALTPDHTDSTRSVALYWDFENLHAALVAESGIDYSHKDNRFQKQPALVDVQRVVDLYTSFGPVAINRAYCNWQYFSRYRDVLLQNAVELVQLFPPGASAKNGADIKLCLDAAEDIGRFRHIRTVVIVGGDSDYMPLAHKIKPAGLTLVGVGTRRTTNRHWAKCCHAFHFYDEPRQAVTAVADAQFAAQASAASPSPPPIAPEPPDVDILRRVVRCLAEVRGELWVNKASIWPMIKRLDSTFDPKEHGHSDLTGMIERLSDLVEVRAGQHDHEIRLRTDPAPRAQ